MSVFFSGCSARSDEDRAMYAFINKFSKKVCSEYELKVFGIGGAVPKKIRKIHITFMGDRCETIEEARVLIVPILEEMITDINHDDRLRHFLENYPANIENAWLTIGFHQGWEDDTFACVKTVGKEIVYYKRDHFNKRLYDVHYETFEEAKQIISHVH